eukprot:CAMPEP_0119017330 /NCGR_PEP_ID=MMETSP1176-20130426/16214_1 /TAXON_ID=265551 /ORGANISM="Synedropsis recta cf, Strain CCMP1620" /LENGTH=128 /DNA_ID=CAMNT_0006971021 /DNA_START=27 /DNA_END=413 /DNA_ORIENTATION=-
MTAKGRGFFIVMVVMVLMTLCSADMKAKWTPANEEGGAGPLPQSMKKRQQLLRLEQVIADSPDPAATLEQVAASMGMKPRELRNMLERNAADMAVGTRKRGGKRRFAPRKLAVLLGAAIAAASLNHFL